MDEWETWWSGQLLPGLRGQGLPNSTQMLLCENVGPELPDFPLKWSQKSAFYVKYLDILDLVTSPIIL